MMSPTALMTIGWAAAGLTRATPRARTKNKLFRTVTPAADRKKVDGPAVKCYKLRFCRLKVKEFPMLDMKEIRDNLEQVEARLQTRGASIGLNRFRELDGRRRALLQETESLKALRNSASDEISRVKDKSQVQGRIA